MVQKLIQLNHDRDFDQMKTMMTKDIVYESIPTGKKTMGVDRVIQSFIRERKAFTELECEVKRTYVAGQTVVAEQVWHMTVVSPLWKLHIGRSRKASLPVAEFFVFEDGKLKEDRVYFDLTAALRQMGANVLSIGH